MRPLFSWRSRTSRRVGSYLAIKHGLSEDEREQCPITVRRGRGVGVPRNPAVDVFGLDLVGQANLEIRKDSFQARFDVALGPGGAFRCSPGCPRPAARNGSTPAACSQAVSRQPESRFSVSDKAPGRPTFAPLFPGGGHRSLSSESTKFPSPEPSPRHPLPLLMTCAAWGKCLLKDIV